MQSYTVSENRKKPNEQGAHVSDQVFNFVVLRFT